MFNVKFHFPAKEEFELFFSRYRAEIQKGLYDGSVLLNKDIVAKSKEPKTGRIYPRKLKSGRIVQHQAANRNNNESTAQMTGAQNKARGFYVAGLTSYVGVDKKIKYARKNEIEFRDMQQGLERNGGEIFSTIQVRLFNFFKK